MLLVLDVYRKSACFWNTTRIAGFGDNALSESTYCVTLHRIVSSSLCGSESASESVRTAASDVYGIAAPAAAAAAAYAVAMTHPLFRRLRGHHCRRRQAVCECRALPVHSNDLLNAGRPDPRLRRRQRG